MARGNQNDSEGNWLASLARQSAHAESNSKPTTISSSSSSSLLTKAQRIERRDQKRTNREDRKRLADIVRQQRLLKKRKITDDGSDRARRIPAQSYMGLTRSLHGRDERGAKLCMTSKSKQAQIRLSTFLKSAVSSHTQLANAATTLKHQQPNRKPKLADTNSPQQEIVNGVPAEPKGKAAKSSTLRPESKELQPRTRDYNGQGLVRPSLYIPFNDPSFKPKVELEFEEHIPGFFGKAKQKAAKKQSDQNMLWRKCLKAKTVDDEKKQIAGSGSTKRRKGKKGAGSEERVQKLMRRGVM